MKGVKVIVHGALGRVGREVVNTLSRQSGMELVGAVDLKASQDQLPLPDSSGSVPLSTELEPLLKDTKPDVLVDFSIATATMPAVRLAANNGINLVIGTTGLSADEISEIERLAREHNLGAVVAPNFALGAVLMIHLAKIAAKYFDSAEIIELHHHQKVDAPPGTALSTARAMAEARGRPFSSPESQKTSPSRGEQLEGIAIHSIRLPGLLAHQEIMLGASGQTLTIRHDAISRECYLPGVILAIKEVVNKKGLTYGLDKLLGL